jgi:hypothetical protein
MAWELRGIDVLLMRIIHHIKDSCFNCKYDLVFAIKKL